MCNRRSDRYISSIVVASSEKYASQFIQDVLTTPRVQESVGCQLLSGSLLPLWYGKNYSDVPEKMERHIDTPKELYQERQNELLKKLM
jgi:hypothetical protein